MNAIIADFGWIIKSPYSLLVLTALCVCFKDTLADMFSSVFSFTKSFLCVVFRLCMVALVVMAGAMALAFGQSFVHFTDKLIAALVIAFLIVLVDMFVLLAKRVLMLFIGGFMRRERAEQAREFTVGTPVFAAAGTRFAGLRMRQ